MDQTTATVIIDKLGSNPLEFVSLVLDQMFMDHHRVQIVADLKNIGENVLSSPMQKTSLVNEKVIITIKDSGGKAIPYTFSGIITDVQVELDKGDHGLLYIYAASPTIQLERGRMMQTFSKKDLEEITDEVTKGVEFSIIKAPEYKDKLKFSMQYRETDFQYLRRLAWMYGEMLHYTGEDLIFGKYSPPSSVSVTYGHDLIEVRLGTTLIANTFQQYYHKTDFEKSPYEHPYSKPGTFPGDASAQSDKLNSGRKPDVPIATPVYDDAALKTLVKAQKERTFADMFHVTGRTNVYRIVIGGLLNINFHGKLKVEEKPGTLRIIRVRHVFDANERYYNEFDAIPQDPERIPCSDIDFPMASAIPAKVVCNWKAGEEGDPDKLGKVQVKFDFDENDCEYWMPVMRPEAGGDPQNRGFIFVPEVDDWVLVSFLRGNPEFPFVMGSLFHTGNGEEVGGGEGNHSKSIRDKAGSEVTLDTKKGSLTIKDKTGSESTIHLDGEKNVSVTADKSITLTTGKSCLSMKEDGTIDLTGVKITLSGEEFAKLLSGSAAFKAYARSGGLSRVKGTTIELTADDKVLVESKSSISINAEKTLDADGKVTATYTGGLIKINS